jgi:hypothetical protein
MWHIKEVSVLEEIQFIITISIHNDNSASTFHTKSSQLLDINQPIESNQHNRFHTR